VEERRFSAASERQKQLGLQPPLRMLFGKVIIHTAMAVCDFYALGDDLRQIFRYVFAETDIVAYELSSDPERPPRQFHSLTEIESAFLLGSYRAGHVQLWSPAASVPPVIRRVEIKYPTPTFRYAVEGAGLMQFYLDGKKDGIIYHTHFGHWNEAGARQRSIHPADDCDWPVLAKLSRKIQYHIRRKLAAATFYARPVLSQALEAVDGGDELWWTSGTAHRADSRELHRISG
jgi:hypothetical protein